MPGRHAEETAQRYGVPAGELVVRDTPGPELGVDRPVQVELAGLDEAHGRDRGNQFGQRGRLEERVLGAAQGRRPGQPTVLDQGEADRRDAEFAKRLGQGHAANLAARRRHLQRPLRNVRDRNGDFARGRMRTAGQGGP